MYRINHNTKPALESPISSLAIQVVRSGELLHGAGAISPTWGWTSPTYGYKIPALSFAAYIKGVLPLTLMSEWLFPNGFSNHDENP
jgi:hypothetical protein